jgi:cyclopropane fatty-acyl-phospholipid synthase-like methyltransferase
MTGFDAMYRGLTPPWDIGRPQPAFQALAAAGALVGRVLDVGCGTGEHAIMAARLGLTAVGVDLSPTAIELAEAKARERGVIVRFMVADGLDLPVLGERFDTVLDCGFFHVLDDPARVTFATGLRAVMSTGGRYHMLCFSDRMPGTVGPRRVSREEIRSTFADGWSVESIEPAVIETTVPDRAAVAWHATIAAL